MRGAGRERRGFRFTPPAVELSPEVRWVLLRAFGPQGAPAPAPIRVVEAIEKAVALDLAPRIAVRSGRARLAAELGEEGRRALARESRGAVVLDLAIREVAGEVAAAAASLGVPVVFLKGAALYLSGRVAPGSRRACDVDVLVPPASVEPLTRELAALGYAPTGLAEHEHQASPQRHRSGVLVELHRIVLGVRLGGRRSASLADLEAERQLEPVEELPGRASVPTRELLAAHALVHGIAQHGLEPASYPLFRMVADLSDLWPLDDAALGRVASWTAGELSREELAAALDLRARLAAGALPGGGDAAWEAPGLVLLRHLLSGASDDVYRRSLKLRAVLAAPTDRSRLGGLAAAAWKAVFLSPLEVEMIYGPSRTRIGAAAKRLLRPLDLVRRAGAHALRAARRPRG